MPVLSNPKHERFAQELSKGKTATEAYILAGYKANDGNAATLKGNQRILDRVEELQCRAAAKTELTIASITENLLRYAQKAEALGEAPGLSVARAAMMDAAKLNGFVVDRKEVRTGELDDLNADERGKLRDALKQELARRAGGTGSAERTEPARNVPTLQ